ncbi:VOC family protein [Streptomyces sp. NPDC003016]
METTLQVAVDCAYPQKLVAFWCDALGYVPEPAPGGHPTRRAYWADMGVAEEELTAGAGERPGSIVDPAGRGPRVWFQRVPEGKRVKNRVHLDVKVSGGRGVPPDVRTRRVTDTVRRLTDTGATVFRVLDRPDMEFCAVVLQDPEGNEFCVD